MRATALWRPHISAAACLLFALHLSQAVTSAAPTAHSARRIALLHMHDGAPFFTQLGSITQANKMRYAARQGYEMVSHTPARTTGLWERVASLSPPCNVSSDGQAQAVERDGMCFRPANDEFAIDKRAATFGKIKLAMAACVGRDGYWMLWSDADALVVNQSVSLESLIDDRYDILVSVDWLMINAGVMLLKCSEWTRGFLERVYAAKEFDQARALDQSALQHFFDTDKGSKEHVKYVPKHAINVYVEEFRAGDFLVHMAGKLYEATTEGAIALAHQFDVLSMAEDQEDVEAFLRGRYLLNAYSGVCQTKGRDSGCPPDDDRRLKLAEPLGAMSYPSRYRHVALRYYWMPDWKDKYDTEGWNDGRKVFDGTKIGAVGKCKAEGRCNVGEAVKDEL